MKGILFNVVQDVVTEALSADAWDDVLDAAGVPGSYTSLGTYPDTDLAPIVQAIADLADLSFEETLRLAGVLGFEHLARRNPALICPDSPPSTTAMRCASPTRPSEGCVRWP